MDEQIERLVTATERLVEVLEEVHFTLREIAGDVTNIEATLDGGGTS